MIPDNFKDSLALISQFPGFIRDDSDYQTFIQFVEAYYQWLETTGNPEERSKNLLNYADIDNTITEFEEYFFNEFLQYFPKESLTSKRELVKVARELYQRKSTPASFKFLFRALFDSDCDIYDASDFILLSSDGKWIQPKSIQLKTLDPRFLYVDNYKIFGTESKSSAKIERSQVSNNSIEIFLSDFGTNFYPGETAKIVDDQLHEIVIDGSTLEATIIGNIKSVTVDPNNLGKNYKVGDPAIFYGGVDYSGNHLEATANVSSIYNGEIKEVIVTNPSCGFRRDYSPVDLLSANGANGNIVISELKTDSPFFTRFVSKDVIDSKKDVLLSSPSFGFANNQSANIDTKLLDVLTFQEYNTFPLSTFNIANPGSGYDEKFNLNVESLYDTENTFKSNLFDLGILGPIKIRRKGKEYKVGDEIQFVGGFGAFAFAKISSVDGRGSILAAEYYTGDDVTSLGGFGYSNDSLPKLYIDSTTGLGAELYVESVLGDGESLFANAYPIGGVKSVNVISAGENYRENPSVSLTTQDIVITGLNLVDVPKKGSLVYQGDYYNSTFKAFVDSFTLNVDSPPGTPYYTLRVYEYKGTANGSLSISIDKVNANDKLYNYTIRTTYNSNGFTNGVKIYGNGKAKATSNFISGLIFGKGSFLDESGQPSSSCRIESDVYNYYSYFLQVEKSFSNYKEVLYNLLHPAGTRVLGTNVLPQKLQKLNTGLYNTEYHRRNLSRSLYNPSIISYMDIRSKMPKLKFEVNDSGEGFRVDPDSEIVFLRGGANSSGYISSIDPNTANISLADLIVTDIIGAHGNQTIGNTALNFLHNPTANANNQTLANVFSFIQFNTSPISNAVLNTPSDYYTDFIEVGAFSLYDNEVGSQSVLSNLGILGKIKVVSGGSDYQANDNIIFTGGDGFGAYANISSVDANGAILTVDYTYDPNGQYEYNLGGLGYREENLPTLTANSEFGTGAILTVENILGDGEKISVVSDPISLANSSTSVVKIENYVDYKENYHSINVSIDIVSSNSIIANANVQTITGITANSASVTSRYSEIDAQPIYNLEVINGGYGFRTYSNGNSSISFSGVNCSNEAYAEIYSVDETKPVEATLLSKDVIGLKRDLVIGNTILSFANNILANANTTLINALTFFDIQTYPIKEIRAKNLTTNNPSVKAHSIYDIEYNTSELSYLGILGPIEIVSGGRNYLPYETLSFFGGLGSMAYARITDVDVDGKITKVEYYTDNSNISSLGGFGYSNDALPSIVINTSFGSGAILRVNSILGDGEVVGNISNTVKTDGLPLSYALDTSDNIVISQNTPRELVNVFSKIVSVDDSNSTITIEDCERLYYPNVALGYATSNTIIVEKITEVFDFVNGGAYSDPNAKINDIIRIGDLITLSNNIYIKVTDVKVLTNQYATIYCEGDINPSGNSINQQLISVIHNFDANNISFEYQLNYDSAVNSDVLTFVTENNDIIYFPNHGIVPSITTDYASAEDTQSTFVMTKALSDDINTTELLAFSTTRSLEDGSDYSEDGFILSWNTQDYASNTYFAETYIGSTIATF